MRVLGIDPGTAIVGYSVVTGNGQKYSLETVGCIYTDKSLSLEERIAQIFNELTEIIKQWKPDVMAVEEIFFFKNATTVISVAQSRGVILLAAQLLGVPIAEYTPLQVKMGITSYGRATKQQVQEMVRRLLNMEEVIKPDDAADAVAIAITHIHGARFHDLGMNTTARGKKMSKQIPNAQRLTVEEYKALLKNK